jgi:hypothetical protein
MKKKLIILLALIGFGISANAQYTYYISSGKFSGSGINTICYSGRNVNSDGYDYRNRTETTNIPNVGAIPAGTYYLTDVTTSKGTNTIVLTEDYENDMYGQRSLFRIHRGGQNASKGCIIMNDENRQKIADAINKWKAGGKKDAILTLYVYE